MTPSPAADVTYRVTFNGQCPRAAALVEKHNARADRGRAPVRTLHRRNVGYDFGGHLDALIEESTCFPYAFYAARSGGAALGRARHARCYAERYPDARAYCSGRRDGSNAVPVPWCLAQHYYDTGRAQGRKFICDVKGEVTCGLRGKRRAVDFARLPYDAFVALNVGVRGPLYPAYVPPGWHWTSAFLDKLTALDRDDGVALVGTSIKCLEEAPPPHGGGVGPKVEGFAFALARPALLHVLANGTSFQYHARKEHAVVFGEYSLSLDVLHAHGRKWNIGSMLVEHSGVDFRDRSTWRCNGLRHTTFYKGHFGLSIQPMEVLFHKPKWHTIGETVSVPEVDSLTARSSGQLF